jgi:hypothetical protein
MNPHGLLPVVAAAVFTAAAVIASVIASLLIVVEMPAKKMMIQASADAGLSSDETAAIPVRVVRVIVASPYYH